MLKLLTSYVAEDGGPAGFYRRLGFEPTGELDANGEVIVRLLLPQEPLGRVGVGSQIPVALIATVARSAQHRPPPERSSASTISNRQRE